MKNIVFILLAILILTTTTLFGQPTFGLKGGLNYADISFNSGVADFDQAVAETAESRLGYHVGAFLHVPISEKLAFKPEVLFSTQGQKITSVETFELHLNYLSIPLLFEFELLKNVGVTAGPNAGYRLSAKSKTDSGNFDGKAFYNNDFDLGITGGLFWQFAPRLRLQANYYQGFRSVRQGLTFTDEFGMPIVENIKNRNQVFQLGLAVFLGDQE